MIWSVLSADYRALCEAILTPAELDAYRLWEDDLGYGRIAIKLGISTSTARGRVLRAREKLLAHLEICSADAGGDTGGKPPTADSTTPARAA